MVRLRLSALVTCLIALLAAACSQAPARPHAPLAVNAEPLRSIFNRDVGKVRIVMVAAPT
jgi:hypothetical protein